MIDKIIGIVWGAVDIARRLLGMEERKQERDIGAMQQHAADQDATIKAKDDQLDKAVNRRDGAARKRLRDKSF